MFCGKLTNQEDIGWGLRWNSVIRTVEGIGPLFFWGGGLIIWCRREGEVETLSTSELEEFSILCEVCVWDAGCIGERLGKQKRLVSVTEFFRNFWLRSEEPKWEFWGQ